MRDGSIDAGLWMLGLIAQPGVPMSCEDIGTACGVTRQHIQRIEQKAIRKCAKKFRELEARATIGMAV